MAAPKKKTTSGRAASSRSQGSKKQKQTTDRHQAVAVILFAVALLLLCVAFITGGDTLNVWSALHLCLHGVCGLAAFLVPILLGYTAVNIARDKERKVCVLSAVKFLSCILCLSAAMEIFRTSETDTYGAAIADAFTRGGGLFREETVSGGAIGAIIGFPLKLWFTDLGAKIVIVLLLFVAVMLITGSTLRTLWKPVKKTAAFTQDTVEKTRSLVRDRAQRKREAAAQQKADAGKGIDIDMGDGYPTEEETRTAKQNFEEAAEKLHKEMDSDATVEDIIGKVMGTVPDTDKKVKSDAPTEKMSKAEVKAEEKAVAEEIESASEPPESYSYPSISLLDKAGPVDTSSAREEMQSNAHLLVKTLSEFNISAKVTDIVRGPSVTRYELQPNAGVKISRITGLADDIALRLATTGVRIEAPIPNKAAIGIEVPNKVSTSVCLRELIDSDEFTSVSSPLTVALGRNISGEVVMADLAKMPHLLIAGTTGSGKSVCTNSMIQSILFRNSPEDVRMILIDPKQVEFNIYNGIPHLLVPVVTDPRKAAGALGWAVTEMLNRYKQFAENNVRDINGFNKLAAASDTLHAMPLILIVIDELSDLMMAAGKEVEDSIVRLAQMARAAGMHLVIATQRPSADVITGLMKANIPSRLALTVASSVDSRIILDESGAEKLLGKGDMLFHPVGLPKPIRVQGCFVSDHEVEAVVSFLKSSADADYDESVVEEINRQAEAAQKAESKDEGADVDGGDEMLPQAIEVVVEAGQASTSLLQRRLRLGYARAGRIIDEMEQRGIVGPHEGSKPRKVLITHQQWLEMQVTQSEGTE